MLDYKTLYYALFADVSHSIENLITALQEAEERFLALAEDHDNEDIDDA